MSKIFLFFIFLLNCSPLYAANKDCGVVSLTRVYVQADRVDGSTHGNKMLIGFNSPSCVGITLAYLENSDEAFSGMLSMALTAYTTGIKVRVFIDDSADATGAKRLQWLNFQ